MSIILYAAIAICINTPANSIYDKSGSYVGHNIDCDYGIVQDGGTMGYTREICEAKLKAMVYRGNYAKMCVPFDDQIDDFHIDWDSGSK